MEMPEWPEEDRQVILQFFYTFTRFECALKRAGFAKQMRDTVSVDWDRYASAIRHDLARATEPTLRQALDFLRDEPPKKQKLCGRKFEWVGMTRDQSETYERYLLRLVCAVRNNLFHGGKYSTPRADFEHRDRLLLKASLVVVTACLPLVDEVDQMFKEVA